MSNDPKKPLDPTPGQTPDLLQKDLNLDRRSRRAPSFEELRAQPHHAEQGPSTQPGIPGPFIPRPVQAPASAARVPAAPQAVRSPGSSPTPVPAQGPAAPRAPVAAAPTSHRRDEEPTRPLLPAASRGPLGAPPTRQAPPSPTEWARPAYEPEAPTILNQVVKLTPASLIQGATAPSGPKPAIASRAIPDAPVVPLPAASTPIEEVRTTLERPVVMPAPVQRHEAPQALPSHLLSTQPGGPRALAPSQDLVAATPSSLEVPLPSDRTRVLEPLASSHAPEPSGHPVFAKTPDFDAEEVAAVVSESIEEAVEGDVLASPAPVWRRVFAWTVDLLIIGFVVSGFLGAALAIIGRPSVSAVIAIAGPGLALVGFVAFVYTTLFAFLWHGRTPGRRLLGIHLVDATGHAPRAGRALLRAALSLASFGLFLSGFWLALFDRRGQTLHDKLTETFVVRLKPAL